MWVAKEEVTLFCLYPWRPGMPLGLKMERWITPAFHKPFSDIVKASRIELDPVIGYIILTSPFFFKYSCNSKQYIYTAYNEMRLQKVKRLANDGYKLAFMDMIQHINK